MKLTMVQPDGLSQPVGQYSQVCRVECQEYAFVAGQLAVASDGTLVGDGDFGAQVRQVFRNLVASADAVGASMREVVKMTTYLVRAQDIEEFFQVREELFREYFPSSSYPPNTLLVIDRLVREGCLIEVEAIIGVR